MPETIFVDDLLKEMQKSHNQMAILMDEYGGVAGLVTVEDLLEEIVGEIDDEYDAITDEVKMLDARTFIVEGGMAIDDFNERFHVTLPDKGIDTIAGFVLTQIKAIPEDDDEVILEYEQFTFIVTEMKESRIITMRVEINEEMQQDLA
ncbi:hypothetical protein PRIP_13639 [Listeria riparia FSL S10-1204]|uniref:CBS domain-containing protein n=1 Tax=Listeria riparia FSL S10-1204 TaxID=1265816 RepID=W7D6F3_9LIST|nr:hypothetical protein PRIP_13639 [Listeria riparia FSL S10-1204]